MYIPAGWAAGGIWKISPESIYAPMARDLQTLCFARKHLSLFSQSNIMELGLVGWMTLLGTALYAGIWKSVILLDKSGAQLCYEKHVTQTFLKEGSISPRGFVECMHGSFSHSQDIHGQLWTAYHMLMGDLLSQLWAILVCMWNGVVHAIMHELVFHETQQNFTAKEWMETYFGYYIFIVMILYISFWVYNMPVGAWMYYNGLVLNVCNRIVRWLYRRWWQKCLRKLRGYLRRNPGADRRCCLYAGCFMGGCLLTAFYYQNL